MMKVAYTGWTWVNSREPEVGKRQLEASFRECKFLGYDYVENFAFIRDFFEDPQELVNMIKANNVNLVNLYGHFSFDVEKEIDTAKKQVEFLAAVGGKWYNCQNAGFGDDGPTERPTNPEMIDKMCYVANTVGEYAKSLGVTLCFHPHYGTCVFSQSDIDYFAEHTNPDYVSFCFDTAHTTLAGINPELHEAAIVDGASVIRRMISWSRHSASPPASSIRKVTCTSETSPVEPKKRMSYSSPSGMYSISP